MSNLKNKRMNLENELEKAKMTATWTVASIESAISEDSIMDELDYIGRAKEYAKVLVAQLKKIESELDKQYSEQ